MKRICLVLLMSVVTSVFVPETKAQEAPLECTLHVKQFKFKKPKFDCKRGFGLCVDIHWDVPLEVEMGAATCNLVISFDRDEPRVDKNEVYAGWTINKNTMWLILPKAIMDMEEYKGEDFSFLPIEQKVVLYYAGKPFKTVMPQKAQMKEQGKFLLYEFELTD